LYLATDNRNIESGDYPVRKGDMDHLEFIKLLVAKGANVNARMKDSSQTRTVFTNQWLDENGATPFLRAAQSGDVVLMKFLLENGAAIAGIIAAAVGLMLSQLTGNPFFDGAASVVIGIILGLTAMLLAYESKGLLIGEAADPVLVKSLHELACSQSGVVGVGHVLTVHSSPDQITVMMNVDFRDDMLAGEVERIVCHVEEEARRRWPAVRRLFVRPMQGAASQSGQ